MRDRRNITIIGAGYVGMSLATLLANNHNITLLDIDEKKINSIKLNICPIEDKDIQNYIDQNQLSIKATSHFENALKNADFAVICTPTNYDEINKNFDTSSVDSIIDQLCNYDPEIPIIIKSTIPVGYTDRINKKYRNNKIIFSPEFLREGTALYDNLYPSRIIMGSSCEAAINFSNILKSAAIKKDIKVLHMSAMEAEAVKLFSNTYLAMRVAFFNELDSYAIFNKLNTKNIIDGVCLDNRIGHQYNNPSFGYGGYCLPKDTKQLLSNFENIPHALIEAIVTSNSIRKDYISEHILKLKPSSVGIYRLVMKKGSENSRSSAIFDIINRLKLKIPQILIYEPTIKKDAIDGNKIINDLDEFKKRSDIIIANRHSKELKDISGKVFTRDIYETDA